MKMFHDDGADRCAAFTSDKRQNQRRALEDAAKAGVGGFKE